MNKDPKFASFITKKFPFLKERKNTHTYKLDLNNFDERTEKEFVQFITDADNQKIPCHHKSEDAIYAKHSTK